MATDLTKMTRAVWNGAVIACTDIYELVEGNVYFPPSSVDMQYAKPSDTHTTCGWKGQASYYTIVVDGKENKDAAWFYPTPKPAPNNIKVKLQPCPVHPLSQLICRCMCCFCKTICPFETWRMVHSFSSPQIESGEMPFILFRRLCMFKLNCVYSFGEVGLVCW